MLTVIVTSTSFFDFSFLKLEFLVLRIIVYGDTKYADFIDYVNARIIYFKTILSHQGVKQSSNLPNNPDIPSSGGGDDRPGEL